MNRLSVEVHGLNGAFYEAQIKNIQESKVEVVYKNNPQLEFLVACDCLRLPPLPNASYRLTVGDEVEVHSRTSLGEPFGWWLAQIKMVVGEWFLVEYATGGQEFVLQEAIRSCNDNSFCSINQLMQSCCLEQPKIKLQERYHQEERREEQVCQAGACRQPSVSGGEPTGSNGAATEELWETDNNRPAWHLNIEPPPPKGSKSARRRRKRQRRHIQSTLEDEYDSEEDTLTDNGTVFTCYGGQWAMY